MADPFDLQRFVDAQSSVYAAALAELRAGAKRTHWMWFVFPQLKALGRSPTAQVYGISGPEEARAYLNHPVLGPRLRECVAAVKGVTGVSAQDMLGSPDDLKLRSSLTLFAEVTDDNADFRAALAKYYAGEADPATLKLLER